MTSSPGPAPVVMRLNDHTTAFYVGRDLTGPSPFAGVPGNWVDAGAWPLGGATYAFHAGGEAIVYDSMTTPETGQWVRDHLVEVEGVERFTLVLSHWHLDHIAGNASYRDSPIVGLRLTREALIANRDAIETGTAWGPPALEVVLPNVVFDDRLDLHLGDLEIQLHHFDIHSRDGCVLVVPADRALFPGDTLEDTVTYVIEPEGIPRHIAELERLKELPFDRIHPNHGAPERLCDGYPRTLIDATLEYDRNLLRRVDEAGFRELPIEELVPDGLALGAVSIWEPYRTVHANNLTLVHDAYGGRT